MNDENEALKFKKNYNHYLDKRKEVLKNTSFRTEDVFFNIINIDSISQEQINKPIVF